MGKIIKNKIRKMNLWAKAGIVLTMTLALGTLLMIKVSHSTPTAKGRIVYSLTGTASQHEAYTASTNAFGTNAAMATGATNQCFMVDKASATRNEHIAGYVTSGGVLYIQRWNGSAWSAEWNVTVGGNGVNGRRFDIAYEYTSGNAMVVYSTNATGNAGNEMAYRVWNGSAWTAAVNINSARLTRSTTNNAVEWIKLASKKIAGSNEIAMVAADNGNGGGTTANTATLTSFIWNGSAWGNEPATAHDTAYTCTATLPNTLQYDNFDLAYEGVTGDLVVAWSYQSSAVNEYRIYNSSTGWGTVTALPGTARAALATVVTANPNTDEVMILAWRSVTSGVVGWYWDGTTMATQATISTGTTLNTTGANNKDITAEWRNSGGTDYCVAVWNTSTAGTLGYNAATGGTWGTAGTYSTGTGISPNWLDADVDPIGADTMMVTYSTGTTANSVSLWATRIVVGSGGTLTFANAFTGTTALSTTLYSATCQNFCFAYDQYPIMMVNDGTNPANANAAQGSTGHELDAFTLSMSSGTATLNTLTLTGTNFTAANLSSIKIYRDTGTTVGTLDASDALVATNYVINSATQVTITFTAAENVTTTPVNYLVVVDVGSGASLANTITGRITAISGGGYVGTIYNDSASATLTVTAPKLLVGDGTNPASVNAAQGSTGHELDDFTLAMDGSTGSAYSVSTLTLTGTNFTAANLSSIKIYRDTGTTVGTLDASDTLVATSYAINSATQATITFTTAENVTTTPVNYLVVVDVGSSASLANTITGRITAATGTNIGTPSYSDTASATLTVTASKLIVGDGTNPVSANAPQGTAGNAMNAFTLAKDGGTGTVSTLTLTGTNFTAANLSSIKIYRDTGTTVGTLDASDTLVATSYAINSATQATITFTTAENVTTTPVNYLVVVDVGSGAVLNNTLSGTITAATGTNIGTPSYSDNASATLTITVPKLTIGNGSNPGNATVAQNSTYRALNGFTLAKDVGTATISTFTFAGSANFTSTNVASIRVYQDNGTLGAYDSADVLVPTTYSLTGSTATITFSPVLNVSTTPVNYLMVVDVTAAAIVNSTLSGTISAVTGTGLGTVVDNDTASATLTIAAKLPSVSTGCGSCHGYTTTFNDGISRNNPNGTFPGSHNIHVIQLGYACSKCHVIPATTTSADYGHRNQLVQMASPINGDTGGVYVKGSSFTQINPPAAFTACNNTYCHSQGSGATSNSGDTRTVSASVTALAWGGQDACNSCHGYPPNYANKATTWGAAKANSHVKHDAFKCYVCHHRTTDDGTTIASLARHANRFYNISSINGGTTATFSYTYAAAGGGCGTIYCHNLAGASQNATWGGTITLGCIDCHSKTIYRTNGRPGLALAAVQSEFNLAWGHRDSARTTANGAVTDADCIVCHLEGNYTTQKPSNYHADGNIDLRDPRGSGETPITNLSGGVFTFQRFSTSFAAGSRTTTGHLNNADIAQVISIKFCLGCHRSGGATNTTARSNNGGTGTAAMPFGGINLGANYTVANGATATGGLVNVFSQFSTGNSSRHPVRGPNTRDFPTAARLAAPYNNQEAGRIDAGGVRTQSVVITCFDCHNTSGLLTTRTVAAHGNAVSLRGTYYTGSPTLCTACHGGSATYATGTSTDHGAGSALGNSGNQVSMTNCHNCHASATTKPARPVPAQDYHGFNRLAGSGTDALWPVGATETSRPYAFIRNTVNWTNHRPKASPEFASGTATCTVTGSCQASTYTTGGTY